MLLWELAFEKIPYENWNMEKIKEWVLSGKRERLIFGKDKPEIEELQQEYKKIIVAGKHIKNNFCNFFLEKKILFLNEYFLSIFISLARGSTNKSITSIFIFGIK